MSRLLFKCPECDTEFSSDIHTDPRSMRMVLNLPVRITCARCGAVHESSMRCGRLVGEEPGEALASEDGNRSG